MVLCALRGANSSMIPKDPKTQSQILSYSWARHSRAFVESRNKYLLSITHALQVLYTKHSSCAVLIHANETCTWVGLGECLKMTLSVKAEFSFETRWQITTEILFCLIHRYISYESYLLRWCALMECIRVWWCLETTHSRLRICWQQTMHLQTMNIFSLIYFTRILGLL